MPLAVGASLLLAQMMQTAGADERAVRMNDDVVVQAVGREEADDGTRREPLFADEPIQHRARVIEQRACRGAALRVVEYIRELAGEFPRVEERHPIDERHDLARRLMLGKTWVPRKRGTGIR